MTTVAVTGASGFVGRHVLAALSQADADVVAHARTPRPEHVVSGRRRWTHFDLSSAPADAFDRFGRPDVVIHLAWQGLPNYLAPRHVETERPAQSRFLRALVASGLKTLAVAGTCFEYGMQSGCLREDMPAKPSNPYGIAKDALRQELAVLSGATSFDLRWLRLFYLYGEGQPSTSLYAQFRSAVARGDKTFDMSAGDQLRDFMRAEDAGAAIAMVALAPRTPSLLNICSGSPTTVRGLVERWCTEMRTGIELNLGVYPYPSYEPFAFWGDARRLAAALGGSPSAGNRRPPFTT